MPTRFQIAALLFPLAAWASDALAFECKSADSATTKLICSDRALQALDKTLNDLYQAALKKSASAAALKAAQRQWVQSVQQPCKEAGCLKAAYAAQIDLLAKDMAPWCELAIRKSFAGTWTQVGDNGPIDEFSAGPDGTFDSWLHHRPDISGGQWQAKGCRINVSINQTSLVDWILIEAGRSKLQMLEEDGAGIETYRQ